MYLKLKTTQIYKHIYEKNRQTSLLQGEKFLNEKIAGTA